MLKIGINKGRIENAFMDYLLKNNLIDNKYQETRQLSNQVGSNIYCSLKPNDIIRCLEKGYIDLGIIGSDMLTEVNNDNIITLYELELFKCFFALASFKDIDISKVKSIASKYVYNASLFLKESNMDCEILKMDGSLELAPALGYADAIIDIVETGSTLKANNLEIKKIFGTVLTNVVTTIDKVDSKEVQAYIRTLKNARR